MGWRYYAQRAGSKEWLDTNVSGFSDPAMSWMLSSPNAGQATLSTGFGNPVMEDGRPLFGKFDTILLVEDENEDLIWFGICSEANPIDKGTSLEFIGLTGWLAGIPYQGEYATWRTKLYNVLRELFSAAAAKEVKPRVPFKVTYIGGDSLFIGDPEPPPQPERTGGTIGKAWDEAHGWKQQYEMNWWEAPMVGKELDDMVGSYGIEYVETVSWKNRAKLEYEVELFIDDGLAITGRVDIEFVDGINLAKPIDVKPGNAQFANRVIGLGAGEGRDMLRVDIGGNDDRLYRAEVIQYKAISNQEQLRRMAEGDLKFLRADGVKIETLVVWDMPGFAPIGTLTPGQEVKIKSDKTTPPIDAYSRVTSITRTPDSASAVVNFEVAR